MLCSLWNIVGQFILEPIFQLAGALNLMPVQIAIENFFGAVATALSCVG